MKMGQLLCTITNKELIKLLLVIRIRNMWVIPFCFLKRKVHIVQYSPYILLQTKLAPVRMKMGQLLCTITNKELIKWLLVRRVPKTANQKVKKFDVSLNVSSFQVAVPLFVQQEGELTMLSSLLRNWPKVLLFYFTL